MARPIYVLAPSRPALTLRTRLVPRPIRLREPARHLGDSVLAWGAPKSSLRRSRRGHNHSHDKDLIRYPSLLLCSPAIIKMALYALAIGAPERYWRRDFGRTTDPDSPLA